MSKGPNITISPSVARLKQRLRAAGNRLKDMRTPHAQSASFLDQWVQRNFQRQGAPVGGWKSLSPATMLGRVRKNLKGGRFSRSTRNIRRSKGSVPIRAGLVKILMDTGRLRASFSPFATSRDAGIGSDLKYSKAHEKGTSSIPQRRILPKAREVKIPVQKIFSQHIKKSFKPFKVR